MLRAAAVLVLSLAYLLLFAIASWGDRRADAGRRVIGSPWIYTLSLAVYCTAWTFYGSVELAAGSGLAFLPIYLGPTVASAVRLPAAQDPQHRQGLRHHLDRRLHRRAVRQERRSPVWSPWWRWSALSPTSRCS